MNLFLWGGLPYIAFTLLIAGLVWRYRTDQYGWTSRSSQLHESTWLRWSSPLFHFGILFVGAGHVVGLLVPATATEAIGVSEHAYHLGATIGGSVAAVMTVVGLAGLLLRRFKFKSITLATSTSDLVMYVLLLSAIALGSAATLINQVFGEAGGYNYRETISVWFRSVFLMHPQVELMSQVPVSFKMHIVAGLILFAVWPFTRLVHVLSAPIGYSARPMIVYRSREAATRTAPVARGWTPVRASEKYRVKGTAQPTGDSSEQMGGYAGSEGA